VVKLHREHALKLESGVYFGKLMHAIRKTVMKKSRKPFTVDPQLANLQDNSMKKVKQKNWDLIAPELKKFNVKLSLEQKLQIVNESSHATLMDIILKLREFDVNLSASSA